MKYISDLKNAFGEPDDGFKNNVYYTLSALPKGVEKATVRKIRIRLAVIIAVAAFAAITTIACAMALSNTWGILDFINNRKYHAGTEISPEIISIVEKNVSQVSVETEFASFKVREGIFDGKNIYIVVEVKPINPDYLLLGIDAMPYNPIGNIGPQFEGKTGTIADYASIYNKTLIHTYIGGLKVLPAHGGNPIIESNMEELNGYGCDYILEDDGTLVYMISGKYRAIEERELELQLTCLTALFLGNDLSENAQSVELSFTITNRT